MYQITKFGMKDHFIGILDNISHAFIK